MKSFYLKIPIRSLCTGSEQEAVDAPALEGLLRQSTWFRTPLGQAGLLSRRSVASAASWSLCRRWSEAPRRSGFDAAREAIRLNRRQRWGAGRCPVRWR